MKPVDPEIEGIPTVQVGAGRVDVDALPAIDVEGYWISFWELDEKERTQVEHGARVIVQTLHYGRPISPFSVSVESVAGVCRECGCTDDFACEGGCSWVEFDLCSTHREPALTSGVELSDKEAARLAARWEEEYGGPGNANKIFRFERIEPSGQTRAKASPASAEGTA